MAKYKLIRWSAAAAAGVEGKVCMWMVWIREARPERARRAGLPRERQITDQILSRYLKSLRAERKTERAKRKGKRER